jgi:hypothetical protein
MTFCKDAMPPSKGRHQETWKDLFQANLDSLFELALLLTSDAREAEANLATVINDLDLSKHPDEDGLAFLQAAVARQSIASGEAISTVRVAEARSIIQPGLGPVLQLEHFPRICFVLWMTFGYATTVCAGMLGIDQGGVRALLQTAILETSANSMALVATTRLNGRE